MLVTIYQLTQYNISEDLSPESLLCRQLQWQFFNNLSHARNVPLYRLLYLQVNNWQLMCSHLERYWGILLSRSNVCCNWGDNVVFRSIGGWKWTETIHSISTTYRGKGFLLSPMVHSGQEGGSVPPESGDLIRIGLGSRTVWPKPNDNG